MFRILRRVDTGITDALSIDHGEGKQGFNTRKKIVTQVLKNRTKAAVTSLVVDKDASSTTVRFLMKRLGLERHDVFVVKDGLVGLGDIKQLVVDNRPALLYKANTPQTPAFIRLEPPHTA
jgi:polyphosphate kinase